MLIMIDVSRSLHMLLAHMTLSSFSIAVAVEFLVAFACGAIMERKGRSNVAGFVLAFLFSVVGVAIVLAWPSVTKVNAKREKVIAAQKSAEMAKRNATNSRTRRGEIRSAAVESKPCPHCSVPVPVGSNTCRVCQHAIVAQIAV